MSAFCFWTIKNFTKRPRRGRGIRAFCAYPTGDRCSHAPLSPSNFRLTTPFSDQSRPLAIPARSQLNILSTLRSLNSASTPSLLDSTLARFVSLPCVHRRPLLYLMLTFRFQRSFSTSQVGCVVRATRVCPVPTTRRGTGPRPLRPSEESLPLFRPVLSASLPHRAAEVPAACRRPLLSSM